MRCIEHLLVAVLMVSVAACSAPPTRKTELAQDSQAWAQIRERFESGVQALEAGDLDAAEAAMLEVSAAAPNLVSPYINMGLIEERRGHPQRAEKWYRQAIDINPRAAEAWNQIGLIARHQGRFNDARAHYEKAAELAPEKPAFTLNLAILCDLYLQDTECALEAYKRYQAALASPNKQVAIWIRDLERRVQ